MNRLLILIGFMLYLPYSYGSSQPPVNLGNFTNQNFAPRVGVVPDTGPSQLAPSVIDGVAPQRDPFHYLAADESLISVSGNVKNVSNPLLNAAGNLTQHPLNTSGVTVMFWQPQATANTRTTVTDENGNYEIQLTNGFWRGEACGSAVGYSPNAWEVTLRDNKLIQMQEVSYSLPRITPNQIDLAMLQNNVTAGNSISTFLKRQGEELSINGEGFGCNGSLIFDFHNSVSNCGDVNPVQYSHQLIVKNDFDSRSDSKIKLPMPSLFDASANSQVQHDDIRRIAKLYYQKGNQRSNAIFVGEYLGEAFTGVVYEGACQNSLAGEINNNGQLTDQSGSLQNIGQLGAGLVGGVTGGFNAASGFGGISGTPFFMMTGSSATGSNTAASTASAASAQTIGSTVMTNQNIAVEGELNLTVNTGALQMNLGR